MKLDKRIKSIDSIRSFNTNNDDCLAEEGYFCNYLTSLDNLECCAKGMCIFDDGSRYPFIMKGTRNKYQFFIRKCDLQKEEKKYRPYTIEEFCNEGFEIVVFRSKIDESPEYHVRYNGYIKYDYVCNFILGTISYTLSDLFENYEYLDDDGEWKPFGVEE